MIFGFREVGFFFKKSEEELAKLNNDDKKKYFDIYNSLLDFEKREFDKFGYVAFHISNRKDKQCKTKR